MGVVQRKAMLKAEGFFPHKKNGKGTSIIYSRKHPTAKFVRVVVDSGIDSKTNKIVGKVGVKLCFVNRPVAVHVRLVKTYRKEKVRLELEHLSCGVAGTLKSIRAETEGQ